MKKDDNVKRLLPINNCYQCYKRDFMECICLDTGKRHPLPDKGIPEWCPLAKEKQKHD